MKTPSKEYKPPMSRIKVFLILFAMVFFLTSSYGIYRVLLGLKTSNNLDYLVWIQSGGYITAVLALAGFGLTKALASLEVGRFRFLKEERQAIQIGSILYGIGAIIPTLLPLSLFLVLGLIFIGGGEGLLLVGVSTFLSTHSEKNERAFFLGVMELSVYLGYSFGALLTSFPPIIFGTNGYALILGALGILISLVLLLGVRSNGSFLSMSTLFTETLSYNLRLNELLQKYKIPYNTRGFFKRWWHRPTFIAATINGHVSKMCDSVIVIFLPLFLLDELHLPPPFMGLSLSIFSLTWALSMPVSGKITDMLGRRKPTLIGLTLQIIAFIFLLTNLSPLPLFFVMALAGLGVGLYYPTLSTITADITSEEARAQYMALFRSLRDFGFFTGALLLGLASQAALTYLSPTLVGSKEVLGKIPFYISIVLLFGALIGSFVMLKETNPIWQEFDKSLAHAQACIDVVRICHDALTLYFGKDTGTAGMSLHVRRHRALSLTKLAKEKEVYADRLLDEVAFVGYHGISESQDIEQFLRIGRRIDRSAGLVLSAAFSLQRLTPDAIPIAMQKIILENLKSMISMVELCYTALLALNERRFYVDTVYKLSRQYERRLDLNYRKLVSYILESSWKFSIRDVLLFLEIVNKIESASDAAEDALDAIRIIALKYLA